MITSYLKNNTAAIHEKVEADNLAKYIMDHSISVEQYGELLYANYKAYATIDTILIANKQNYSEAIREFIDQSKTKALREDLLQLSFDDYERKSISSVENQKSEAYGVGLLYVIEGSMLGGLLMAKNLPKCAHLKHLNNHYFFGKEATDVLPRWKYFCTAIDALPYDEVEKKKALQGATDAFAIFDSAFQDK